MRPRQMLYYFIQSEKQRVTFEEKEKLFRSQERKIIDC